MLIPGRFPVGFEIVQSLVVDPCTLGLNLLSHAPIDTEELLIISCEVRHLLLFSRLELLEFKLLVLPIPIGR
jgi:hypothetical protein